MKVILISLLAGVAAPALGQHSGHSASSAPPAATSCTPEHAAMGHCTIPAPAKPADPHAGHDAPVQQQPAADPHAGHQMPAQQQPQADAHAGHDMTAPEQPAPAADPAPHAGYVMPAVEPATSVPPVDPHAGHDMSTMPPAAPADPHAGHGIAPIAPLALPELALPEEPPPPEAFMGPRHAADLVYNPRVMAEAREELHAEMGAFTLYKVMADQLEARVRDGRDGYLWDAQGWYGGDVNKLWIKTEGEGSFGENPEGAEVQALYSRAITPWFDVQAGVRYDFQPNPERAHLVIGLQGLVPYEFEVDAAAFLSHEGDLTARFEAEYDQLITQRLILQPRMEFELAAQDVPEIGIGSGLTSAEVGVRLRYEIAREFAPYVGVEYERAFGDTADFRRASGEEAGGWSFVLGVRAWF